SSVTITTPGMPTEAPTPTTKRRGDAPSTSLGITESCSPETPPPLPSPTSDPGITHPEEGTPPRPTGDASPKAERRSWGKPCGGEAEGGAGADDAGADDAGADDAGADDAGAGDAGVGDAGDAAPASVNSTDASAVIMASRE